MKNILLIAGARPNFMKIAPIIRAISEAPKAFDYKVIHTGQHYDREMSDVFFEELEIPKPDYYLECGGGSHAEQTAKIMLRFEKVCLNEKPDLILVVGDVNSTLACSIVAKKLHIRVAHVEAGLRSGDMLMPEEINRIVTDAISDYFFVTERSGVLNLRAEGKPSDRIYFVGHVMIDNLYYQLEKLYHINPNELSTSSFKNQHPSYGVVTLHRPSNVDRQDTLQGLIYAMSEVSKQLPLFFSVHPRTQASLIKYGIKLPENMILSPPLAYMDFLNLFKDAKLVLTDSGGIQEETTAIGVPCLTLRESTERPITVSEGTNILVGISPDIIIEAAKMILNGKNKKYRRPKLWDGQSAKRIVKILSEKL
jgi:UDP-N-acetylglucosamine 2-epimerase (non-hydrolysing)